ncbi:MAG: UDP-glucose 4-epimerase GalE [Lachnospiraceae bacterium]|nr:UDP-glucose 4-epimerase GalE [Lachnospiraceae bacterium]
MMVLVTGGTGYIGSHTAVELLKQGEEIVIVDNFSNSKPEVLDAIKDITGREFKFYNVDILDKQSLSKVFKENKIDSVINFAGFKAVGESVKEPIKYYYNNITGILVLLQVMREFDCKSIIFSSTATVYGEKNPIPYKEEYPVAITTNPYATTKLFIEQILKDTCIADKNFKVMLLRYFNPIGAHESGKIGEDPNGIPNNLMPYIAQVAAGKLKTLNVFGNDYETRDGTGVRDYIHVVDLAIGHIKALEHMKNSNAGVQTYNLGTGIGYSVLDIINTFEKVTATKIDYKITERRPGDIAEFYADASKAERELGWKATRGIIDMCRDTWNFAKNKYMNN